MTDYMKYSKLLFLLLIVALAGCQRKQPIVILYENDAHCAVEGYARLAGQRDAERQHTPCGFVWLYAVHLPSKKDFPIMSFCKRLSVVTKHPCVRSGLEQIAVFCISLSFLYVSPVDSYSGYIIAEAVCAISVQPR